MKYFTTILLVTISLLMACNNGKTYADSKEDLLEKEKESPLKFLSIKGNDKRNLFGQTVVKATVTNKASVCTYDKVRIKLLYFDKAGKQVANHEDELENPLGPNSTVKYTARYFTPKGTDSVAMSIMGCRCGRE
jgi:hypothetical protein